MDSDEPKIRARNLDVTYQRSGTSEVVVALDGFSIDIAANSFTCIVGPSGCGKSTFLNALAGLLPYKGHLTLDGQPVTRTGRDRGFVFQSPALLPWRTAEGNAAYGLEIAGASRSSARAKAREILEFVGLTHGAGRYPHELSGGMQQRVNLARALALDPVLLLLDEPFAALDSFTRANLQQELLRVWEETRKTAVFVTHDIEEAVFLADEVVVLTAGPGSHVEREFDVPLERPRTPTVKRTQQFLDIVDEVTSLIHFGRPPTVA